MIKVFASGVAFATVCLCSTAFAQSLVVEDTLLVLSPSQDRRPALSGSRVLFQSDQLGTFDIFRVVGPDVAALVASGTGDLEDPRVDGDVAVWTDDSLGDSEVIFYDFATGSSENISASPGNDLDPDVDGETAVWVSDSTGSPEVFYWSVAVPVRQPLALTPGADRAPAISGGRVVWATNSTVRVGLDLVVSEIVCVSVVDDVLNQRGINVFVQQQGIVVSIILYPFDEKVVFLTAGFDLLDNLQRHLDATASALMGNPLPELGNLIDCVIGVVRRYQHIRIEEV